jgi:hypothetical protein
MAILRAPISILMAAASLIMADYAKADDLTSGEQALVDKGATMELFSPREHSRHFITNVTAVSHNGKKHDVADDPILCFVFGMEDAAPAREEGKSMAEFHYSPAQAEQFLFAQGWDKYHDRFFTRAYVQEGLDAYEASRRRR